MDDDKDTGADSASPPVEPSSPSGSQKEAAAAGGGDSSEEATPSPAAEEKTKRVENRGRLRKTKASPPAESTPAREKLRTPAGRPSRERKSVERYSDSISPFKSPTTKQPSIHKGSGSMLRDIPNVLYKISKSKIDQNLQALHVLLFGKKSNAHYLKRNILQFSGFLWSQDDEEKIKAKLKEKLFKINRGLLFYFCEVLDIPILKSANKEETCSKLIVFLGSPCVTRDVLLSEKEKLHKHKKRRRVSKEASKDGIKKRSSSKAEPQRRKSSSIYEKEERELEKEGEKGKDGGSDDEGGSSSGEGDSQKGNENTKSNEDGNSSEEHATNKKESTSNDIDRKPSIEPKEHQKKSGKKETSVSKSKPKTVDLHGVMNPKKKRSAEESISSLPEVSKTKKSRRSKSQDDESQAIEKGSTKDVSMLSIKEQGEGNLLANPIKEPNREELYSVISDILKEADFDKVTLADLIKQLGTHFKTDMLGRKLEVKSLIEEVMNNMSDDEEDEADPQMNHNLNV